MAAPAFVNLSAVTTVSAAVSMTMNMPASIVRGNALIALTSVGIVRAPITWPSNWTPIGQGEAAWRIAQSASEPGPTINWSGLTNQNGWVVQYGPLLGVGNSSENQIQSGATLTVPGVGAKGSQSLFVCGLYNGNGTTPPSLPAGYTNDTTALQATGVTGGVRFCNFQATNPKDVAPDVSTTVNTSFVSRGFVLELIQLGALIRTASGVRIGG